MSEELKKDIQAEPEKETKNDTREEAGSGEETKREQNSGSAENISEGTSEEDEISEETADEEAVVEESADGKNDGEAAPDNGNETKAEKKSAKKKFKIDKKQDAMKEKIEELEDKVKRQMAEFDNFRKRTEKEKSSMFEMGAKSVIEKILPVVDNFERGLSAIPEEQKGDAFAEGMEMIYKQLISELEKMEVKPIPAVGEEFDPNFHNAVMQVESEEYESGVIAQELQKGYTYRDSVVRHSMVAVVS